MSTLRQINIWKKMDKVLLFLYLALVTCGVATVYASGYVEDGGSLFSWSTIYGKQFYWAIISLGVGFFILLLEGLFIKNITYFVYGGVILLLVTVLFMPAINGAHSWFKIGSFTIQPAEFAKFACSLAVAKYLSESGVKITSLRAKITVALLIGLPMMLIILEPDPGTGLIFLSFILVMYREGLSGSILLGGLGAAVIAILGVYIAAFEDVQGLDDNLSGILYLILILLLLGLVCFGIARLFVLPRYRKKYYLPIIVATLVGVTMAFSSHWAYENVFQDRHKDRFQLLYGLKLDRQGSGYNIYQALSAVGSGKFSGKGYLEGTLSNDRFKHVPEQSTDFIFCSWAEERGFIGGVVLVFLFAALLIRCVVIAERQRSQFTRIFAYCVCSIILFHFIINIAMVLGLAPVIGIPLPFFSKGGSAILGFSILIFILLRLDAERKDILR